MNDKVVNFHTFGDSHAKFPWEHVVVENLKISVHWLGPKLMHTFGREKKNVVDIAKFGVRSGDVVCFSFGEIDCRCHVKKHAENGDYQTVIDRLVEQYADAIEDNTKDRNVHTCVFNVVPPAAANSFRDNPDYPLTGTDAERRAYVSYMNDRLAQMCAQKGFTFIAVHDAYADENGMLNRQLSDGSVHLRNPIHVEEFLRRWIRTID